MTADLVPCLSSRLVTGPAPRYGVRQPCSHRHGEATRKRTWDYACAVVTTPSRVLRAYKIHGGTFRRWMQSSSGALSQAPDSQYRNANDQRARYCRGIRRLSWERPRWGPTAQRPRAARNTLGGQRGAKPGAGFAKSYGTNLTYSRCVKKPVITPGNTYSAMYFGLTVASANSQNRGISEKFSNL